MLDWKIKSCVGFAFPKLPSETDLNKRVVVKVTVTWKDFVFQYHLQPVHRVAAFDVTGRKTSTTPSVISCFVHRNAGKPVVILETQAT